MEEKGSKRFGAYLRKLREDRRLTLDTIEELSAAQKDRISKTYLSRCENGRALPSFTKLFTLSKLYKTRLTALAERLELDVELESMPDVDLTSATYEQLTMRGQEEIQHGNIKLAFLLFNAAWDLATLEEGASRSEKEAQARLALAIALNRLGRLEMAEEECKSIVSIGGISSFILRRALILLSWIYHECGRAELARIMIGQAQQKSDPADLKSEADIASMMGLLETEAGSLAEARKSLARANTLYESLKDEFNLCKTYANTARVELAAGRTEQALDLFNRSLELARRLGYQYYVAKRLHDIGLLHYSLHKADQASKFFYESNELARRADYYDTIFLNCYYLWKIALERGDRSAAALNEKSLRFYAFKIEETFPELEGFKAFLEKGRGKP